MLSKEFADSAHDKEEASELIIGSVHADNLVIRANKPDSPSTRKDDEEILIKDNVSHAPESTEPKQEESSSEGLLSKPKLEGPKVVGKIDLEAQGKKKKEEPVKEEPVKEEPAKKEPVKEEKVEEKPKEPEAKTEEVPPEVEEKEVAEEPPKEPEVVEVKKENQTIQAKADSLKGLTVLGKIELPKEKKKEKTGCLFRRE